MSIRFYFLRKQAKDKESAKRLYLRLEKERIALLNKIDAAIDAGLPLRKTDRLTSKAGRYDDILHYLAEKAGMDYDETEIGQILLEREAEYQEEVRWREEHIYKLEHDKEYQDEFYRSHMSEVFRNAMKH